MRNKRQKQSPQDSLSRDQQGRNANIYYLNRLCSVYITAPCDSTLRQLANSWFAEQEWFLKDACLFVCFLVGTSPNPWQDLGYFLKIFGCFLINYFAGPKIQYQKGSLNSPQNQLIILHFIEYIIWKQDKTSFHCFLLAFSLIMGEETIVFMNVQDAILRATTGSPCPSACALMTNFWKEKSELGWDSSLVLELIIS